MEKPLIIKDWQNKISPSRYTGFEFMHCVNLDEDGVLKINHKPIAMTEVSSAVSKLLVWIGWGRKTTTTFRIYGVGAGILVYLDPTNGWTGILALAQYPGGTNIGAITWGGSDTKEYLLYSNAASVHAMDCADNTLAQASMISTLDTNRYYTPMFVASNNRVYIGNGSYLAEIYENDGETFDPSDSDTFTFTADRLDLPDRFQISCLAEMGDYLVIGTKHPYNPDPSTVYLWDKSSSSFEQPIVINVAGGVNQIKVHKGIIFIQAGPFGDWYYSLGGYATKCAEIPVNIRGNAEFKANANVVTIVEDRLYFGLSQYAGTAGLCGIWSFDTKTIGSKNRDGSPFIQQCILSYIMSNLEDGTNDNVEIGALLATTGKGLYYSWLDDENSSYGVDAVNSGYAGDRYLYSNSDAYVITPFYQLGGYYKKAIISKGEFQLAKALDTNESVTLQKRTERDGSWTAYDSITSGQSGGIKALPNIQTAQFKILLDAPPSSTTGPELLEIRLY